MRAVASRSVREGAQHSNMTELANVRAEEAVIGKIVTSAEAYWEIAGALAVEHFTVPHHRDIFSAVANCCMSGESLSLSLLEARLPLEWENVGSREAVLQVLIEKAADVGSPTDFVDDLLTAWRERERIAIGRIATQQGKTFDETRAAIEDRLRTIDDVDRAKHAVSIGEAADVALRKAAAAYETRGRRAVGLTTGIREIDKMIGPLTGGTLVTIAARSGHGKSALVSQILRHAAQPSLDPSQVHASLFLSFEMSREQNGYRNLASMTGISPRKQRTGDFTDKEYEALIQARRELDQMPIHIQDRGALTTRQYAAECRMMHRRLGVKLFVLDHLKLIPPEQKGWDLVRTIEYASQFNKELSKELDAVFIQLAQITKEGQKSATSWRFKDSDIYGGGGIKESSDIILGVALPMEWLRQNKPEPPSESNPKGREAFDEWLRNSEAWKDQAEIAALKVRDGESGSWTPMGFHGARMIFGDADREDIPF